MSNRIAHIRNSSGITQQQLADRLNTHLVTVSKLERGKIQLTTVWIEKIAVALGCSASDIWEGDAVKKTESLTVRLSPDLRARVDAAISTMPYRPTLTAIVERGLELALIELERMANIAKGVM